MLCVSRHYSIGSLVLGGGCGGDWREIVNTNARLFEILATLWLAFRGRRYQQPGDMSSRLVCLTVYYSNIERVGDYEEAIMGQHGLVLEGAHADIQATSLTSPSPAIIFTSYCEYKQHRACFALLVLTQRHPHSDRASRLPYRAVVHSALSDCGSLVVARIEDKLRREVLRRPAHGE